MEKKDFIEKFAEAIELDDVAEINAETNFRELDEWNSLAVLSVIAMMDEEFGLQIKNSDFQKLNTIGELLNYLENQ